MSRSHHIDVKSYEQILVVVAAGTSCANVEGRIDDKVSVGSKDLTPVRRRVIASSAPSSKSALGGYFMEFGTIERCHCDRRAGPADCAVSKSCRNHQTGDQRKWFRVATECVDLTGGCEYRGKTNRG